MRSDTELLNAVYQRAEVLRTTRRRRRSAAAAGTLAAVAVAAGVVVAATGHDREQLQAQLAGPAPQEDHGGSTPPPDRSEAEALGRLEIPAIALDVIFVDGVSADDLSAGPGLYPETPIPGHGGNSAIAGYRTTNGPGFQRLDELEPGDEIVITTSEGVFTYQVRETLIREPAAVEVLEATFWTDRWGQGSIATLTLTTEHPTSSGAERMIVGAQLSDRSKGPER